MPKGSTTVADPTEDVAPPLCEAKDCPKPPLTTFGDGDDCPWWLCEEHGDLLAVGFETRRPRRLPLSSEATNRALRSFWGFPGTYDEAPS